jgi:hypothetical protein
MALVAGIGLGTFVIIFIILFGIGVCFIGEKTEHPWFVSLLLLPLTPHSDVVVVWYSV